MKHESELQLVFIFISHKKTQAVINTCLGLILILLKDNTRSDVRQRQVHTFPTLRITMLTFWLKSDLNN